MSYIRIVGLSLAGMFLAPVAWAAAPITGSPTVSITSIQDVICYIYYGFDVMFWILIALSTVMVIVGAFNYVTANGESEKVSKGNKTLVWAAIGVAVALIAYNVPNIVGSFFLGSGHDLNQSACY